MDAKTAIERLDILIAKANKLLRTSEGVSRYLDPELRTGFRAAGLAFMRELFGEADVHYTDFQRWTDGITVSDAKKARGLLCAIREEFAAGRQPTVTVVHEGSVRNRRRVFVVHGRNEAARTAMFAFLRAVGLQPLEWTEAIALTASAAPYVGQVLDSAFREAQAVVVLLTGDDLARLGRAFLTPTDGPYESELTPQARPNVLFEAGMALGRHPERTILVALGDTRPFSDVAGRHTVRLDNSAKARQDLLSRLKTAGCEVDVDHRTDWLKEGDFDTAVCEPDAGASGDSSSRTSEPAATVVAIDAQQRSQVADEKKFELLALIHQIRLVATSFPSDQAKAEQIRKVTLWSESDLSTMRNLAAAFGMTAARLAAEASRHLATISTLARSVQDTPRARGFAWQQFDWEHWYKGIEGAERCLVSLATEIDPDWRSLV